ncbi:MAG: replication protein RepA, partial [bacterium]
MSDVVPLRPIDQKRLDALWARTTTERKSHDVWYIHTVLAQCFLPYRDPKTRDWTRHNGDFSIALTAGQIKDHTNPEGFRVVGLPYGAKPRLFQSYVCTQAIRHQSPVIPVERSMTAMMQELGLKVSGGKEGSINLFKEQITRFAACKFTIVGPGPRGGYRHINAEPFESFDVWFPPDPNHGMLWPAEIVLT